MGGREVVAGWVDGVVADTGSAGAAVWIGTGVDSATEVVGSENSSVEEPAVVGVASGVETSTSAEVGGAATSSVERTVVIPRTRGPSAASLDPPDTARAVTNAVALNSRSASVAMLKPRYRTKAIRAALPSVGAGGVVGMTHVGAATTARCSAIGSGRAKTPSRS